MLKHSQSRLLFLGYRYEKIYFALKHTKKHKHTENTNHSKNTITQKHKYTKTQSLLKKTLSMKSCNLHICNLRKKSALSSYNWLVQKREEEASWAWRKNGQKVSSMKLCKGLEFFKNYFYHRLSPFFRLSKSWNKKIHCVQ